MKSALIAGLVTLAWASPAPQLDTIKDIFRDDYYGDASLIRIMTASTSHTTVIA